MNRTELEYHLNRIAEAFEKEHLDTEAQAVREAMAQQEIIRCANCKWYEGDIMANPWGVCCHDGWVDGNSGHEVSENGWCYRAERRTDG